MPKKKRKSQKGKTVKQHPDIRIIDRMLKSGWPPSRVSEWLGDMEKKPVSTQTLGHYRDNFLDVKLILPASVYEKKLKQLNVQIDTLRELYNLIELQKRRLKPMLEYEEARNTTHPDMRLELQLLRDTIIKSIELEMSLGVREKAAIKIEETKFDMAEMLKSFIAEREAKAMSKVIEP